jgi:hypothetical protein
MPAAEWRGLPLMSISQQEVSPGSWPPQWSELVVPITSEYLGGASVVPITSAVSMELEPEDRRLSGEAWYEDTASSPFRVWALGCTVRGLGIGILVHYMVQTFAQKTNLPSC